MVGSLLLSIHNGYVTFGNKPLFNDISFNIHERDRICLVGKNGSGKTTLMHLIRGTRDLDGGKRWHTPGLTIGYLQQEVKPQTGQTVFDFIFSGLDAERQKEEYTYMVEMVLEPFSLRAGQPMETLSGGQLRQAALARALVEDPDILLLDEPTNHLDLDATLWLEEYIQSYRGTLVCVSHDKTFLSNISDKILWLDRGHIRICPKGFAHFDEWSQTLLEQEERELKNREKFVAIEEEWASRGVKARRKRNMRRVEDLQKAREKLKADKSLFNKTIRKISLEPISDNETDITSKIIAEFIKVDKTFTQDTVKHNILNKLNLRILRGDRIGILGKNGSGKTTFLKLITGELTPDMGKVKLAKTIAISYFDQKRKDLKLDESLWKTLCPNGGDYLEVGGKLRHVCGYLKDFLFDPKAVRDLVGTLSGGQQNRLLLAKVLAHPGNFLILDEPTNDLDMDTLDMLEEILSHYKGTLLIVSHDRDFLDQTVTKILAFEGEGEIEGYIGGYSDYLEASGKKKPEGKKVIKTIKPSESKPAPAETKPLKKLSFSQQYELDTLPKTIDALEQEIASLYHQLASPTLYATDPDTFDAISKRWAEAQKELEDAESRWLELEELKNAG